MKERRRDPDFALSQLAKTGANRQLIMQLVPVRIRISTQPSFLDFLSFPFPDFLFVT